VPTALERTGNFLWDQYTANRSDDGRPVSGRIVPPGRSIPRAQLPEYFHWITEPANNEYIFNAPTYSNAIRVSANRPSPHQQQALCFGIFETGTFLANADTVLIAPGF